jgi:hypothetical protein
MLPANAVLSTTGLGGLYFISAPAAGIALGLKWPLVTFLSWAGYSTAGAIVTSLGTFARGGLKRFLHLEPDRSKNRLFWRCWEQGGLLGLSLIAPVTIGPKGACLLGLALGEKPWKLLAAVSLGALPWALALSLATQWGLALVH